VRSNHVESQRLMVMHRELDNDHQCRIFWPVYCSSSYIVSASLPGKLLPNLHSRERCSPPLPARATLSPYDSAALIPYILLPHRTSERLSEDTPRHKASLDSHLTSAVDLWAYPQPFDSSHSDPSGGQSRVLPPPSRWLHAQDAFTTIPRKRGISFHSSQGELP